MDQSVAIDSRQSTFDNRIVTQSDKKSDWIWDSNYGTIVLITKVKKTN